MSRIHPNSIKAIKEANERKRLPNIKCGVCFEIFHPQNKNVKNCSRKCAGIHRRGRQPWNKGLKGYMAGKNHHWYGRNMTGKNNPAYLEDRTRLKRFNDDSRDRRSSAYVTWRNEVCKRDNWKCRIADCNCSGKVVVHHILPWRDFPELRYQINNGITLCQAHHPRKRAEENRLIPIFQELVLVSSEQL